MPLIIKRDISHVQINPKNITASAASILQDIRIFKAHKETKLQEWPSTAVRINTAEEELSLGVALTWKA